MKFRITFVTHNSYSVSHLSASGFELADPALEAGIPLSMIPDRLRKDSFNAVIETDIKTARDSGLFEKDNSIHVHVDPRLNDYAYIFAEWNPENEETVLEWRMDYEKLTQDWKDAGCPAVWNRA